jgi:hypothetical protein
MSSLELNSADRCDHCDAQAWVRVRLVSGKELLFCAHDFGVHEASLRAKDATWDDQRDRINVKLDVSA